MTAVRTSWDHDPETGARTGVCEVILNRPDKLNALTVEMGESFIEHIQEIGQHPDLKAVVLAGEGRAFSAGGDLDFLLARRASTPAENSATMRAFYARFLSVRALPVPVIAAVHGPAIGAGLCLAMACDLRVVAQDAKLGATFVGLGLHPGMAGTHFFSAICGPELASYLLLSGAVLTGGEAARRGLALDALPREEVRGRALAIARGIALQSPVAVRATTRTLRAALDQGLERALQREADAQALSYASADLQEGITALKEKRAARFPGA